MKKILLLLFIALCGTFIYLKVQTLGAEDSKFNQTTRYTLGKHPVLRAIFGLHKDGDAREEYLIGNSSIVLEVVQAQGVNIREEILSDLAEKIEKYTGRKVQVFNYDTISDGVLSQQAVEEIVKKNRRHMLQGQPNFFLIYAYDYEGRQEEELARTYEEFGMLFSYKRLKEKTESFPEAQTQYTESTFLHEFGHQMGMSHVDRPECVMSPKVEKLEGAVAFTGSLVATDFCPEELRQLEEIKQEISSK